MRPTLPPLKALRSFEAAARLQSFKRAAEELNVTPAAISQQIKILEETIGLRLFHREYQAVKLTAAARLIYPDIHDGFETMFQAMKKLRKQQERSVLKVASAPAFATQLLIPELHHFRVASASAETDVYVIAAHETIDYDAHQIDIGIRYGRGNYAGLTSEKFLSDSLCPVCSPELGMLSDQTGQLKQWPNYPLLHNDSLDFDHTFPGWPEWLRHFGFAEIDGTLGLRFNIASDAITAAVKGAGILLARQSLIRSELAEGKLMRLFDLDFPLEHGFHLVYPKENLERDDVLSFRNWVMERFAG